MRYLPYMLSFTKFASLWLPEWVTDRPGARDASASKKNVRIIGFMVFKTIGSDSRFQRKNRFWKICTESRDIGQNMWNFAGLIWKADFGNVLADISGLGAYFSKPIFAFKPWFKAGRFEYHEPYNPNKFFFTYKGVRHFIEIASPQAKSPQKWKKQSFSYFIYRYEWELG